MQEQKPARPEMEQTDPVGADTLNLLAGARNFNRWMFSKIRPHLHGEVLEIGSGMGNHSGLALAAGLNVTLSDLNPAYRAYLKRSFGTESNLRGVLEIDLQEPNFAAGHPELHQRFHSIFLLNVIEHLADEELAVEILSFLLKPGGTVVVLAPAYQWLFSRMDKELGHYRRYTKKRLARPFLHAGFRIARSFYFNVAGISGWFLFGKLLRRPQLGPEIGLFEKLVPVFRRLDGISLNRFGLNAILVAKKNTDA